MKLGRCLCLIVVAMLVLIDYSVACSRKRKKGKGQPKGQHDQPIDDQPTESVAEQLGDVQIKIFDSCGYDAKGAKAQQDNFMCDFEGECKCCWKNSKAPYDMLDFVLTSGSVNLNKLSKNFKTSSPPAGSFLLASTNQPAGKGDRADVETCTIPCSSSDIKVTLKYWGTEGVKFHVCQTLNDDPNTLLNCQPILGDNPGPETVTLAAIADMNVVVSASNFTGEDGSTAMIDDISVEYIPCRSTISTPLQAEMKAAPVVVTDELPNPGVKTLAPSEHTDITTSPCCKFDQGLCSYKRGSGPKNVQGKTNDFEKAGPKFYNNLATGVPPSQDKAFAASFLKAGENCYMESEVNMPAKRTIKFQEYKAAQEIKTKVCCDMEVNCLYDTKKETSKTDYRQWYQRTVECPAGTKKIVFYGENSGNTEGGVGFDNIELFDENGNQIC